VDKNIEIQLGSTKNIDSTNVDTYDRIKLDNQRNEILEYNIKNILSITDVFEAERQNIPIYRVYGGIEYISLLNGLLGNYQYLSEYFEPKQYSDFFNLKANRKDIYSSFNFYLLRPIGYYYLEDTENEYVVELEVVATPDNFDIFNAGYSRNLFNEPKYGFVVNKDLDISNWIDGFGFPVTELFLYAQYNKSTTGSYNEEMKEVIWFDDGGSYEIPYNSENLNIGDRIYSNKIKYYKSDYLQVTDEMKQYIIETPYNTGNVTGDLDWGFLRWKYEPFIPLKLRYFSNEVSKANINSDDYEQRSDIPYYATDLGNGNMVWREILKQGYIDPLTGNGVDYPFVNKRRYLFSNIILSIIPDLDDNKTSQIFSEINFDEPSVVNKSPINNLNNIGKPCQ
jgi:hypothetical protein